ncbi:sugar phosphate nucleotidyltransferase [Candidatus Pelagibacter sp.]|nr:sugar phosphate nucleotidyltransferase [Candidatus Pelagibacter sp.]
MISYQAIILSGGKGTRVKKYTKKIPKCLIRFNNKPFLYYQLKYLKENNIKNVIISVCYLSKQIKHYVDNNIDFINVKIVDEKKPLGTGGATINSLKFLDKNFYIIYGDSYLNFSLKKLNNRNNLATMAIYKNNNNYDISNIEIKSSNKIIYHAEKKNLKLNYIDYGVSIVNKNIFVGVKKKIKFDLSRFFEKFSKQGKLYKCVINKRFYEIGSYNGIKDFKDFLNRYEIYR